MITTETTNIHLDTLISRYPTLQPCQHSILQAFEALKSTFTSGNKLLTCGNGGSSSDADHLSGELLKSFSIDRTLPQDKFNKIPTPIAKHLQGALPTIPLSAFPSLSSAYANDCDGDYTYAQLTQALGTPGDSLLSISTSGNSRNVLLATETANALGFTTIALTGQSGGKLASIATISIKVPESSTPNIQELHLPIYHTLAIMLEYHFFA